MGPVVRPDTTLLCLFFAGGLQIDPHHGGRGTQDHSRYPPRSQSRATLYVNFKYALIFMYSYGLGTNKESVHNAHIPDLLGPLPQCIMSSTKSALTSDITPANLTASMASLEPYVSGGGGTCAASASSAAWAWPLAPPRPAVWASTLA